MTESMMLEAIKQFETRGGSPEELGMHMYYAIKAAAIHGWEKKNTKEYKLIKAEQEQRITSIKVILDLPHGKEILRYHRELI